MNDNYGNREQRILDKLPEGIQNIKAKLDLNKVDNITPQNLGVSEENFSDNQSISSMGVGLSRVRDMNNGIHKTSTINNNFGASAVLIIGFVLALIIIVAVVTLMILQNLNL